MRPDTARKDEFVSSYYIVFSCFNYGDEFDLPGFELMSQSQLIAWIDAVRTYFTKESYQEMGFGTNESLMFDSYDDVMNGVEWTGITHEQYELLQMIFGRWYGTFPSDDIWLDILSKEEYQTFKDKHPKVYAKDD